MVSPLMVAVLEVPTSREESVMVLMRVTAAASDCSTAKLSDV